MATQQLLFDQEARHKLLEGITKLTDILSPSFGFKKRHLNSHPISSGYDLIKNLSSEDPFVNIGISIGKEAAAQMQKEFQEGIKTTLFLLKALVEHGLKHLSAGMNPVELKRGIEKEVEVVLEELKKLAKPIVHPEEVFHLAFTLSAGDREIATLVSQAIQKVGVKGMTIAQTGNLEASRLIITEGLELGDGHADFCIYADTKTSAMEMQNATVLLIDRKMSSIQELLPLLQTLTGSSKSVVIIGTHLEGDLLSTLKMNRVCKTLEVCVVQIPKFTKEQAHALSALTGACLISEDVEISLRKNHPPFFGFIEKALISKNQTILIGKKIERDQSEQRSFSNQVAVLQIGGSSPSEKEHRKKLCEQTLSSLRTALEEGVIPGGGIALLRASQKLLSRKLKGSEGKAARVILKACEEPLKKIAQNGSYEHPSLIKDVLSQRPTFGFNSSSNQIEDLLKCGVIDYHKIVATGLQVAIAAASKVFLSEVLIG